MTGDAVSGRAAMGCDFGQKIPIHAPAIRTTKMTIPVHIRRCGATREGGASLKSDEFILNIQIMLLRKDYLIPTIKKAGQQEHLLSGLFSGGGQCRRASAAVSTSVVFAAIYFSPVSL